MMREEEKQYRHWLDLSLATRLVYSKAKSSTVYAAEGSSQKTAVEASLPKLLRRSRLRVNSEDELDWLERVHQPSHPLLCLTNGVMVYLTLQATWWSGLFSESHPSHRRHFHSSHLPKTRPSHQTLTHHERNETRLFEDVFPFERLGAALDV